MCAVILADSLGSAVRSSSQQQRRVREAFRQEDDRVQFDAITHGDHDVPLREVEFLIGGFQLGGDVARQVGGGLLLCRCEAGGKNCSCGSNDKRSGQRSASWYCHDILAGCGLPIELSHGGLASVSPAYVMRTPAGRRIAFRRETGSNAVPQERQDER